MNWFYDDFDYRANSDDSPELFLNWEFMSNLPQHLRMLYESADWRVDFKEIGGRYVPVKIVRKRNPMYLQHEETPPEDSEDALDHADVSLDENGDFVDHTPRDVWDLVYEVHKENGKWVCYSADHFPSPRSHHWSEEFKKIERLIRNGDLTSGRLLHATVRTALQNNRISRKEAKRLWDIFRQEEFLRNKKKKK